LTTVRKTRFCFGWPTRHSTGKEPPGFICTFGAVPSFAGHGWIVDAMSARDEGFCSQLCARAVGSSAASVAAATASDFVHGGARRDHQRC
jgi:hypothetical protein